MNVKFNIDNLYKHYILQKNMNNLQLLLKSHRIIQKHGNYKGLDACTIMIVHSARVLRFFLIAQPIVLIITMISFCYFGFVGEKCFWNEMIVWNKHASLPFMNIPGMILLIHVLMFLLILYQFLIWKNSHHARYLEIAKLQ